MSDIDLVERFKTLGFPHGTAHRLVSLLSWIQVAVEIPDLMKTILSLEDNLFLMVAKNAEGILGLLSSVATDPTSLSISNLQTLIVSRNGPKSIIGLLGDRERIKAFVDAKYMILLKSEEKKVRKGSNADGESHTLDGPESKFISSTPSTVQSGQSYLNPRAQPFVPIISIHGGTEDERCLYLTFSKGHPLTSSEIIEFFNEMCNNFGGGRQNPHAVKTVYIHKGEDGMSLFGKVVFCNPYIPGFILGKQSEIRFVVNGKTLLCKRFVRRNSRNNRMEYLQNGTSNQIEDGFGNAWYGNSWGGQIQGMGDITGRPQLVWPQVVGVGTGVVGPSWPVGHVLQPVNPSPRVVGHVGPPPQGVIFPGYYHGMMGTGWGGVI